MFNKAMASILLVSSLLLTGTASAQEKPVTLNADVKLERIVDEGGDSRVELVEAEGVVPGDVLVFTTHYRNGSGELVTDFVILNPVPASVLVTSEAATSTEVSVDGGKNWGSLDQLSIAGSIGVSRPATAGDVTHLRWIIARLSPGQSGAASYRATVR